MVDVTVDETTFQVEIEDVTYDVSVSTNAISGALNDITDVVITSPATGEALTYNGSAWVNLAGAGTGDMTKVVYDSNDDGVVDAADTAAALTGAQADAIVLNTAKVSNVDHPLVETAVPLGAVFTDTIYDDTAIQAEVDLNTAKVSFDWDYDYADLINTPTTITAQQASDITTNNAKISYTDSAAVTANTAKVSADGSVGTHSDVDLTGQLNGQVLTYNSTSGNYEPETPASGVTDHTLLSNIGTNTHAQVDSHIADATIHYTQASISIPASQISDFDTEVANNTAVAANTAKVSYTDAVDVGLNTSFRTTPSTVITAGTDLSWSGNTLNYTGVAGGDVSKVGTPSNNQIGVWTGDGTIEGDSDLTYDGNQLIVNGARYQQYNKLMNSFVPTLGNNDKVQFTFGKETTNNNSAEFTYFHSSDGNTSNKMAFGLYGGQALSIDGNDDTTVENNLTVGGNITVTGTVDGVDIATDVGANSAFTATPSTVITAGTDLSWTGNTLNYTGSGGGISWSTPVDSSITFDTDSTYDIGTSTVLGKDIYFDNYYVQDKIVANGDTDTYIDFSTDNKVNHYAGNYRMMELLQSGDRWVRINPDNANMNFVVNGDTQSFLIWVNGGTDEVNIKNLTLSTNMNRNNYGTVTVETAGEALVAGDIVYLKSDGKYWKADASVEATCASDILMATESISADSTGDFLEFGEYTTTGLTTGSTYYISETAGAFTATKPSTTGTIVRIAGYALSTTVLKFKPSQTFIEN